MACEVQSKINEKFLLDNPKLKNIIVDDDTREIIKKCCTCKEYKNLFEFHRYKGNSCGLAYNCKSCALKTTLAYAKVKIRCDQCFKYITKYYLNQHKKKHCVVTRNRLMDEKLNDLSPRCNDHLNCPNLKDPT